MRSELTMVPNASTKAILRRTLPVAVAIIGIVIASGCAGSRCTCHHQHTSPNCCNPVAQNARQSVDTTIASRTPATEYLDTYSEADETDNTDSYFDSLEADFDDAYSEASKPGIGDTTTIGVVSAPAPPEPAGQSTTSPLYGRGDKYTWLVGVLQRVHVPRKGWKIRYAPLDQQDKWGGSVVPAADVRLDSFKDGDNIYVEGEIIGDRASLYLSGPRYRVSTVRLAAKDDLHRSTTNR